MSSTAPTSVAGAWPEHQPLAPGAEPDHLAAGGQQLSGRLGVVVARPAAQVRASRVHQASGREPQRLLGSSTATS